MRPPWIVQGAGTLLLNRTQNANGDITQRNPLGHDAPHSIDATNQRTSTTSDPFERAAIHNANATLRRLVI
jgi:hypothetical protein